MNKKNNRKKSLQPQYWWWLLFESICACRRCSFINRIYTRRRTYSIPVRTTSMAKRMERDVRLYANLSHYVRAASGKSDLFFQHETRPLPWIGVYCFSSWSQRCRFFDFRKTKCSTFFFLHFNRKKTLRRRNHDFKLFLKLHNGHSCCVYCELIH